MSVPSNGLIANPSLGAATFPLNLITGLAGAEVADTDTVSPIWKGMLLVFGSVDVSLTTHIILGVTIF